ncbi:MAG: asparaginase [Alphaproteobacteria bacterium]
MTTPVAVEVWRGSVVESRHRVAVAVAATGGRVIARVGDAEVPVFPRSAIKPIQAVPLVETGAADAFELSDAELALACASHSGEPVHTERVAAWLARLDLAERDLECGAHAPLDREAARALRGAGRSPTPVHNNCSGKHTGMLTTAVHLGEPTAGYLAPDHPVQRRLRAVFEEFAGTVLDEPGVDGCGVPSWPLPLDRLAVAMANMVERPAAGRLFAAMRAHPELVAGTGRLDTALMRARPDLVAKGGAEGVHVAVLPEPHLAVAVKAEDGAARAGDVALLAVLERLVGGIVEHADVRAHAEPPIANVAGRIVGAIRAAEGWPSF